MGHGQIVKRGGITVVATFALAFAASSAPAASHLKTSLTATGKDPDARGRASIVVRRSHGKLKVVAQRLGRGRSFEVIVDSVRIGTLATGAGGNGKARFSTTPRGRDQLLGVDPRGKLLEVRDEDGDDVLETEMPDDSDPGEIRCCVVEEDDHETECESTSPAECEQHHGVNLGAGSCMPNPCETTPPADKIRCCIPDHDEDGPECEDLTADACSREGGVSIGPGDDCEDDACGPTPPPEEEIRCCIAEEEEHAPVSGGGDDGEDGDGDHGGAEPPECERLTAGACAALHGTNLGAGSCEPNPCAASPSGAFVGETPAQ